DHRNALKECTFTNPSFHLIVHLAVSREETLLSMNGFKSWNHFVELKRVCQETCRPNKLTITPAPHGQILGAVLSLLFPSQSILFSDGDVNWTRGQGYRAGYREPGETVTFYGLIETQDVEEPG